MVLAPVYRDLLDGLAAQDSVALLKIRPPNQAGILYPVDPVVAVLGADFAFGKLLCMRPVRGIEARPIPPVRLVHCLEGTDSFTRDGFRLIFAGLIQWCCMSRRRPSAVDASQYTLGQSHSP